MIGVKEWLEALGLGRYASVFADNGIDLEVLPELSEEDLEALGVLLGHRRKILKAVKELADGGGAPARVEVETQTLPVDAERRQITVMFCDLVGSTALSESMDPEDLRALMQGYQRACASVIERYEGHVAQYLGDGVMTYFGWPTAHEDDAERAVRAALEITGAVKAVEAPEPLRVRIGIATGPVVVGETGEDASMPKLAVGETPNMAARLQGLAGADEIIIAATTRRLVGGVFEVDDLGEHALKGIVEPVHAHRVAGESAVVSRFEASHAAGMTRLVGRDHEIGLLLDRWSQAKDGEGQVVLLTGEPGIGKSRLVQTLRERLGDEPTRLRYQCSAYHANSALHPVIAQVQRVAGFARDDTPAQKLDKLEGLLAQSADDVGAAAPLFAAMLSLDSGARYPPLDLTPQKQLEKTIDVLAEQVAGLARRRPVLMIVEDAHWIDPTTAEFVDRVIDRIEDARVLVIVTFRSELERPWQRRAHVALHTLTRLSRRQTSAMVETLAGKPLPGEVHEQIVAKTDGVPLFVEELTKTVLEAGFLKEENDRYVLRGPLPPLAIPATLQDSLMARLDRLAPVREVAQIGAVIGREFGHELLASLSPLRENELEDALSQLVSSGLVFRRGQPPEASYAFKTALVQDVAYESLLKSRRQQLHARIAEILPERFAAAVEAQPELLAHHLTEAGLAQAAVRAWLRAGRRAQERSANREAIAHLEKGLALVEELPDSPDRVEVEIALNLVFGMVMIAARGFVPAVEAAFLKARDLSERAENSSELFTATWGLWHYNNIHARLGAAIALANQLLDLADGRPSADFLLQGHHASWTTNFLRGNLAAARDHAEHGCALYDATEHRAHKFVYGGHDPGVCGRVYRGLPLWLLGYPDQAQASFDEGVRLARDLAHPMSLAQSLTYGTWTSQFRREADLVAEHAEEAIRISTEQGIAMYPGRADVMLGWVSAQRGRPEDGIETIREGLAACQATGSFSGLSYYLALLAETHLAAGDAESAMAALAESQAAAERTGERWWAAEIHRLQGEAHLARAEKAAAEACLRRALDTAKDHEAKSLELRAAMSLARLRQSQGKTEEARELLAPVYGWFTEGFDTADLMDAKLLLDDLGSG